MRPLNNFHSNDHNKNRSIGEREGLIRWQGAVDAVHRSAVRGRRQESKLRRAGLTLRQWAGMDRPRVSHYLVSPAGLPAAARTEGVGLVVRGR